MLLVKLVQGKHFRNAMASIAIGNMLVINFKKDGLRLRAVDRINMVLGVVQIESSSFDHFRCDKDMSVRVNFIDFNQILSNVTDEDAITIQLYDCGNRQLIGFVFDNYRIRESRHFTLLSDVVKDRGEYIDESIYDLVVGITPRAFRRIIAHLADFVNEVDATVTDMQVKFSTKSEEIILTQSRECTIEHIAGYSKPRDFMFGLQLVEKFNMASFFTRTVYIKNSLFSPTFLKFPGEDITGYIMFYFFRSRAEDIYIVI